MTAKTHKLCSRGYNIESIGFRFPTKEKKDLIFLHGYLSNAKSFCYQTKFFSRDFNVHAFDLKGFGDNAEMEYPYSLDDYVRDVKDYIDKNGLRFPHVVAHSFGARIAIKLASVYPDAFDKIVLTGAAGLKPKRSVKYCVKKATFTVVKPFLGQKKPELFYSEDYLSLNPVMRKSFVKIVAEHLDCRLKYIQNPTFIVFGEKDKETPIYMARKLHKEIKNSKLLLIKGAGHFCFIDSPEKFNWEVREFLLSKKICFR